MNTKFFSTTLVMVLAVALPASPQGAEKNTPRSEKYQRPSAEEALTFLQSLPAIARTVDGKRQMVLFWKDKTAADVKTMVELAPGGHIEGGDHLRIDGRDWKYFTAFENLQIARLYEIHGVDDEAFYQMGHLSPTVKFLFVEGGEFSDHSVKHLQALKNLEFLGIGWNKSLTDQGVPHMAGIPSLTEIQISGCPGIRGTGLSSLAALKNLKKLQVGGTSISDSSLDQLRNLTVEELNLSETSVSFEGLKALLSDSRALKNLKMLQLKKVNLTSQNLANLQQLRPALKIVN